MKTFDLMLKQFELQAKRSYKTLRIKPKGGWVKYMRNILGMTIPQLASRLEVDPSRISRIQHDEIYDAVTLHTLRKVADALECDLFYEFIPKKPISELLKKQAYQKAKSIVLRTSHSMELEDQKIPNKETQAMINDLTKEFMKNPKQYKLWEI